MQVLPDPRQEALAQGLAQGMTVWKAGLAAGYKKPGGSTTALSESEPLVKRIEEIRDTQLWGGTRDLAPVINALAKGALKAIAMNSAAGVKAGGELLRIVADLKQRLPADSEAEPPLEHPMTPEEWIRKFKPVV